MLPSLIVVPKINLSRVEPIDEDVASYKLFVAPPEALELPTNSSMIAPARVSLHVAPLTKAAIIGTSISAFSHNENIFTSIKAEPVESRSESYDAVHTLILED